MSNIHQQAGLEPQAWLRLDPEESLFRVDVEQVTIKMAAWGVCHVIGEPHSGKTRLLNETQASIKDLWGYPTYTIDGSSDGMSPDRLSTVNTDLRTFRDEHGEHGAVFLNHLGSLTIGKNAKVNEGRAALLRTVYDIARERKDTPVLFVASPPLIPNVPRILHGLPGRAVYLFQGEITEVAAHRLLAEHMRRQQAQSVIAGLLEERTLTYGSVQRAIEVASTNQRSEEVTRAMRIARRQVEQAAGTILKA